MGEIAQFMGQIQEQSELSNSTVVNSTGHFEIAEPITFESSMEVEDEPETCNSSQNMDEQLLLTEEEDDKATAREEPPLLQPTFAPSPLPQPILAPPPSNSSKVVPNSITSNSIPPNVPFPHRFMHSKEEVSEKVILEAFPKVQIDILILGATK